MKEEACITLIIPVYNVEAYLGRCMESVLNQSYQNLEIILVDDGATDQSGHMCDEYAEKDNRIKVIHKKNGGLSSARNAALDIATGEYIGFVDSDDYIHPQMFTKLYEACIRNKSEISICCHYTERNDKLLIEDSIYDEEECLNHSQALETLIKDSGMKNYAWDKLYKAELFTDIRYPEGRNYEDIATTYLLFYKANKICRIPEYLYYYQIREGSISGHNSDEKWYENCYQIILSQSERYEFMQAKKEEYLADLCLAEIVPYIYAYIKFGVKLNTVEHREEVIHFLLQEKENIISNRYLSDKDKKLLNIYTSSQSIMRLFQGTRATVKKIKRMQRKTRDMLMELGFHVNHKYDFSLQAGKRKRLLFFELPCFDNLGDHAIAYAQKQFLSDFVERHPEYQLYVINGWDTVETVYQLKQEISKEDIIVCQGGGNMGSLYDFAEAFRMKIMKHFGNHKIIIFPQSIYFSQDDKGEKVRKKMRQVYNGCMNLTICARDNVSYQIMQNMFTCRIKEVNDIVSYLNKKNTEAEQRDGIIVCLRSDMESALDVKKKKQLQAACEKITERVHITDTCLGIDIDTLDREKHLNNKWNLFGSSRLVVTDRLHGMIFSLITATPCVVLGNNHHKVKATYHSFKKCPYLWYAESVEDAITLIKEKYNIELPEEKYIVPDYFEALEQLIVE